MSILTEEEMDKAFDASMAKRPKDASNAETRRLFAVEVESAVLAKLAGMELPEPEGKITYPAQPYEQEWTSSQDAYSESQLHQAFAQGAASQLASEPVGEVKSAELPSATAGESVFSMAIHMKHLPPVGTPLYILKEPK